MRVGRACRPLVMLAAAALLAVAPMAVVAITAGPAAAATVTTEAGFRAAWTAGTSPIDLGNSISLTCTNGAGNGVAATSITTPIVVDGHGFSLIQTCTIGTNNGVFEQDGTGQVTVQNLTVTGGNHSLFGAVGTNGSLAVVNSTIVNNSTGTNADAGISSQGPVVLRNSTVSNNTCPGNCTAGISEDNDANRVTLINSTVSNNTAGSGNADGGVRASFITLVYSTIVDNSASGRANVGQNTGARPPTQLTSFASVVALPGGGGPNCGNIASTTSNGFNFSDDASCGFTNTAQGDRQNAGAPGLAGLANSGGPTLTRLPQPGSPLIDAILNASCQADGASGITTDQRGLPRPSPPGGACDIGAVEVQVPTPVVVTPRFTG